MPSVMFSQKEFDTLFGVVIDLNDRGEIEDAAILDGLAKKMANSAARNSIGYIPGFSQATAEAKSMFVAQSPLESIAAINQKIAKKSLQDDSIK